MNNNINDPRETGVQGMRGLVYDPLGDYLVSQGLENTPENLYKLNALLRQSQNTPIIGTYSNQDFPDFGNSRFDKRVSNVLELQNLSEFRAQEQPWIGQLTNGILKGVGLAATTFTNGVLGGLVGIGEAARYMTMSEEDKELYKQRTGNENAFEAFWHNSLSKEIAKVNEHLEELLPNYYTQYEIDNPFRLNANTIGDKFLKNIGFMVGAAYSGRLGGKILGNILKLDKTRQAFKGATILGKSADALTNDQILKMLKQGATVENMVEDVLVKNAKKLKNASLATKLTGVATASLGEAQMEANMNVEQYYQLDLNNLNYIYEQESARVEDDLFKEHPEWFSLQLDENGNITRGLTHPLGLAEYSRRQRELKAKHEEGLLKLQREATKMGNRVFLSNFFLLSATNFGTLGRFLGGGYSAGRLATNNAVKGSIKGNIEVAKKSILNRTVNALKAPIMEGVVEEMMQESINAASGLKASSHLNEFWGKKVNPEAEDTAISFMEAMAQGMKETYGSAEGWEVGAIAALSSIIALPRFKHIRVKDPKTGKKKFNNITEWFEGEFWENIKENKEVKNLAKKYVDKANENSDNRIQTLWDHAVRGIALEQEKQAAVDKNDKFEYLNAESASIANDVILYSRLGMYQELVSLAEQAENITEDDVDLIKELTSGKDGKGFYSNKSNKEIVADIKERASKYKATIERMHKTGESLKVLYGENISDESLLGLTYGLTVIDDSLNRIREIIDKDSTKQLIETIRQRIKTVNEEINDFNKNKSEEEKKANVKQVEYYSKSPKVSFEQAVNDLMTSGDTKTLRSWLDSILSNPEFVELWKNDIGLEHQEAFRDLLDLNKIIDFRDSIIDEYNTLASNPELFTDEGIALQNKIIEDYNKKEASKIVSDWKESGKPLTSYKDLVHLMSSTKGEYEDAIIKEIEDKGSEEEKKIVQGYKEVKDRVTSLYNIINNKIEGLSEEERIKYQMVLHFLPQMVFADERVVNGETFDNVLEEYSKNDSVFSSLSKEDADKVKILLASTLKEFKDAIQTSKSMSKEVKSEDTKTPLQKVMEKGTAKVKEVATKVQNKAQEIFKKEDQKEENKQKSTNHQEVEDFASDLAAETTDVASAKETEVVEQAVIVNENTAINSVSSHIYTKEEGVIENPNMKEEVRQVINTYAGPTYLSSKDFYKKVKNGGWKYLEFVVLEDSNGNLYAALKLDKQENNYQIKIGDSYYQILQAIELPDKTILGEKSDSIQVNHDTFSIYSNKLKAQSIFEGLFTTLEKNEQKTITQEDIDNSLDPNEVTLGIVNNEKNEAGEVVASHLNVGNSKNSDDNIASFKGGNSTSGHVFLVVPTVNGLRARGSQTITLAELVNKIDTLTKKENKSEAEEKLLERLKDKLESIKEAIYDHLIAADNEGRKSTFQHLTSLIALKEYLDNKNISEITKEEAFEFVLTYYGGSTQLTTRFDSREKAKEVLKEFIELGILKSSISSLSNVGVSLTFMVEGTSTVDKSSSTTPINPTLEEVHQSTGRQISSSESNEKNPVFSENKASTTIGDIMNMFEGAELTPFLPEKFASKLFEAANKGRNLKFAAFKNIITENDILKNLVEKKFSNFSKEFKDEKYNKLLSTENFRAFEIELLNIEC